MEAFEAHWKNSQFSSIDKYPRRADEYYDHMAPYNIAQDIWRAALEWAWDKKGANLDALTIAKELEED